MEFHNYSLYPSEDNANMVNVHYNITIYDENECVAKNPVKMYFRVYIYERYNNEVLRDHEMTYCFPEEGVSMIGTYSKSNAITVNFEIFNEQRNFQYFIIQDSIIILYIFF